MHYSIDRSINLPLDWVIHQAPFLLPAYPLNHIFHRFSPPVFPFPPSSPRRIHRHNAPFVSLWLDMVLISTIAKCLSQEEPDLLDPQWSVWSEWSPCSRTCDGGATYQTRICLDSKGCPTGRNIRYQICNMQVWKHFPSHPAANAFRLVIG